MDKVSQLNEYAKENFHSLNLNRKKLTLSEKYLEAWNTRPLSMSLLSPIVLPLFVVAVILISIGKYLINLKNKWFKKS